MNQPAPLDTTLKPAAIVIFGITGDLAQRKLLPALYHLVKDNLLHEQTRIIGITRRKISAKDLLNTTKLCVIESDNICDPAALKRLGTMFSLQQMDITAPGDYTGLRAALDEIETRQGICMNRLFYLAIPPQILGPVVRHLGECGLDQTCRHGTAASRLLVEKPFGYDLASAQALIAETNQCFTEPQIFRIDHYLAKETAQNILAFRSQNPIFQAIWNNQHIRAIDIVATETIGIEGRGNFYEQVGALRDLIQSHLLQLLALTTMEQPPQMTSGAIHAARLHLLRAIEPIPPDSIARRAHRAQYAGYRDESGVADSITETYAAIEIHINTPRWQNVPITLRTGKALAEKKTAINLIFGSDASTVTNTLSFYIQPNEGIGIDLLVKQPGFSHELATAAMEFNYESAFHTGVHPDAYERVLVDAIRGDRTLFATSDEVLAAWRIVEPVIHAWAQGSASPPLYPPGTPIDNLPLSAAELLQSNHARDTRRTI